jgi:hypothetical protein
LQPDSRKPLWSIGDYQSVADRWLFVSFFLIFLWPCLIVVGTVKWVVAFHSFRTVLLVGTQRCSRAALGGISSQDYSGGLPWRVIAALILLLNRLAGQETLSRNQIRRSSTGFRHRPTNERISRSLNWNRFNFSIDQKGKRNWETHDWCMPRIIYTQNSLMEHLSKK